MLAERKAMTGVHKINPLARTFRFYMEEFVNPVQYDGLQAVTKERPDNPVEFLAYYIIQNNPKLKLEEKEEVIEKEKPNEEATD